MKISVKRSDEFIEYDVGEENILLSALEKIKKEDASLSFRSGCRSGVCGSCAVRVNGREQLACTCKIEGDEKIEPLRYHEVIKDLVVKLDSALSTLDRFQAFGDDLKNRDVSLEDEKRVEVQSDCILCHSCYSACPVYEIKPDFAGPFTLSRIFRYEYDGREDDKRSKIDRIQQNAIWDCTLCGECSIVCPQGLDPKGDIMNLRAKSGAVGYTDPNLASMSFGGGFNAGGFGFNP